MDVLFVCDAGPDVGYGHLMRCRQLAALLPQELHIGFQGRLPEAQPWPTYAADEPIRSRVAVIDRMADKDHMEVWDPALVDRYRSQAQRVVYISSSHVPPEVPDDVLLVGYQPGGSGAYWGLEYAPVSRVLLGDAAGTTRDVESVLIALGGHTTDKPVGLAVQAALELTSVGKIHVLLASSAGDDAATGPNVVVHRGVPSIAPLLAGAGVVVASYGNLCFEALALGTPLCMLGQKPMQAAFAARMAATGRAIDGGLWSQTDRKTLSGAIERARTLAVPPIDAGGLERIAALIIPNGSGR